MSSGNFLTNPDRYRHSYQLGKDVNIASNDTILESEEDINSIALGRKESAHIILEILSKLDIPWMRESKRLPGWGDEL